MWYGEQASVQIGSAWTTISTSTDLQTDFTSNASGTDFSAEVTDITITDPEACVEALNVLGSQLKQESRPGLVNVDFTMVFSDIDMFEQLHGAATTITGDWKRISGGEQTGTRPDKSILFKLTKTVSGTTYTIHYLLNNAWFTSGGEISLAGDGRAEWTGSAVCLVDDRYIEDNF
jgi:hypothetical protein